MRSPFKFLDAYTEADQEVFFGRAEEVAALTEMLQKNRLVLIYGPSGAGKTSLVQCGLSSQFHPTDWLPILIRRHDGINQSLRSALTALMEMEDASLTDQIDALYAEYLRPVYLIFDQFEELLILGSKAEQSRFADDLRTLLGAQLPCRILLIMREEYLARLYPFERSIPRLFTRRLRVEPMSRPNLKKVITGSCSAFNITFEAPEAGPEKIIDNLSQEESGLPLPYLQAYLDQLYQLSYQAAYGHETIAAYPPPLVFQTAQIEQLGAMENVLERFLWEQLDRLQNLVQKRYPDAGSGTARQVADAFVTQQGTKRPVSFTVDSNQLVLSKSAPPYLAALPADLRDFCLRNLEDKRILTDAGGSLELAHDSLAAIIDQARTEEQRVLNRSRSRIEAALAEYQVSGMLLTRQQLVSLEGALPKLKRELSLETQAFLQRSYEHAKRAEEAELEAERAKRRRARKVAIVGFGLAALTTAAFFVALFYWGQSERLRKEAVQAAFEAGLRQAGALRKDGAYPEAIATLNSLGRIAQDAERQQQLRDGRYLLLQLDSLTRLARKFEREAALPQALQLYQQSYALSPDSLLQRASHRVETSIEQRFRQLLAAAQSFSIAKQPKMARQKIEEARALQPEQAQLLDSLAKAYSLTR